MNPAREHRIGQLYVREAGQGPPVLLLHGNSEDHRIFDPLIARLAPRFRVLAWDARAHGASGRGDGDLTIARMADDAARVLAALDAVPAHIVGFSDGGNVALELALRHPGTARSLVLCGANLEPTGLYRRGLAVMVAAGVVLRAAGGVSRRARIRAEKMALMTHDPHIEARQLSTITVPALVVAGQRDVIRPEHTELIASALPNSRLYLMLGADHMIPTRHPQRFADLVEQFLRSLPG